MWRFEIGIARLNLVMKTEWKAVRVFVYWETDQLDAGYGDHAMLVTVQLLSY